FTKVVTDVEIALNSIDSISSNDWVLFSQQVGLTPSRPISTQDPFAQNVSQTSPVHAQKTSADTQIGPSTFSSRSIIKVGQLDLGGLLRWNTYCFTLTRYGFLHYFSSSQVLFFL